MAMTSASSWGESFVFAMELEQDTARAQMNALRKPRDLLIHYLSGSLDENPRVLKPGSAQFLYDGSQFATALAFIVGNLAGGESAEMSNQLVSIRDSIATDRLGDNWCRLHEIMRTHQRRISNLRALRTSESAKDYSDSCEKRCFNTSSCESGCYRSRLTPLSTWG
jgi:hypothetical protein